MRFTLSLAALLTLTTGCLPPLPPATVNFGPVDDTGEDTAVDETGDTAEDTAETGDSADSDSDSAVETGDTGTVSEDPYATKAEWDADGNYFFQMQYETRTNLGLWVFHHKQGYADPQMIEGGGIVLGDENGDGIADEGSTLSSTTLVPDDSTNPYVTGEETASAYGYVGADGVRYCSVWGDTTTMVEKLVNALEVQEWDCEIVSNDDPREW